MCLLLLFPFGYFSPQAKAQVVSDDDNYQTPADSTQYLDLEVGIRRPVEETDSVQTIVQAEDYPYGLDGKIPFNPSPERAIWLSALCPGLGQIYNRRYWKLPIVVGGFMGLAYATSWNNSQYQDDVQAYRDRTESAPDT
ncbi:MAG: hypothetical protein K2H18_02905, partial [Muribaculaceae bacterium]|nr:hypothetical protein [Muribaculaceae bacterium]